MSEGCPPHNDGQIAFIFNVRINRKERFQRLKSVLHYLGPTEIISARIRGQFGQDPVLQEFGNFEHIDLFSRSTFQEWKLDTLEQVSKIDCKFFVLLQEDHLPMVPRERLLEILGQCTLNAVDFMPLSFFPQYRRYANHINQVRVPGFENSDLSIWELDKLLTGQIAQTVDNYPVNLIGFFSKRLLMQILLTERPFVKNYSIEAPFDFEQKHYETWYLPIRWALPKLEIFACVDDDHGIPGYSLSTRHAGQPSVLERQVDHHESGFVLGELPSLLSLGKQFFIKVLPSRVLVLPRNLKYSWESLRGYRKRKKIQKRLLSGV